MCLEPIDGEIDERWLGHQFRRRYPDCSSLRIAISFERRADLREIIGRGLDIRVVDVSVMAVDSERG